MTSHIFHLHVDLLQQRSLSDDERALFTVWQTNSVAPYFVTNFKQFLHNYSSRYEYDIWGTDIDWNLFVIAGGSVISSLLVNTSADQASDVDLFFIEGDANLFYRAVVRKSSKLLL